MSVHEIMQKHFRRSIRTLVLSTSLSFPCEANLAPITWCLEKLESGHAYPNCNGELKSQTRNVDNIIIISPNDCYELRLSAISFMYWSVS